MEAKTKNVLVQYTVTSVFNVTLLWPSGGSEHFSEYPNNTDRPSSFSDLARPFNLVALLASGQFSSVVLTVRLFWCPLGHYVLSFVLSLV
jgi:hypothetical protein